MCSLPDDSGVVAVDGADDIGIPCFESAHGDRPQLPKINHFMARGIKIRQQACEATIAGLKVVIVSRRDGAEASALSRNCLPRIGARQYDYVVLNGVFM